MSRTAHRRVSSVLPSFVVVLALVGVAVNVWRPTAPPLLHTPTDLTSFPPQVLADVEAYRGSQRAVALVGLVVSVAVPVAALTVPWLRARLLAVVRRPGRAWVGAVLGVTVVLVATDVATLPTDVWVGWFHERDWGFAAGGLGLWLRDRLVGLLVRIGAAGIVTVVLWSVVRRAPRTWHHWLVILATVAAAVVVLLHPLVVQPLFLSTEPLAAGPTRDAVREVLVAAGEPDLGIEVGDASTRTTRINAFVTGLGPSRRVVLYDTLLGQPPEQVAHVVAHELAHRQHADLPRGVALTAAAAVPVAWVLRRLWMHDRVRQLRQGAGGQDRLLPVVGLVVLVVATTVGAPIANALSRRAEAAADHRALELTGRPAVQVAVSRVFVIRDLADPDPPWWVTTLWGSHPSAGQRIQAAVDHAARTGRELPDLADLGTP